MKKIVVIGGGFAGSHAAKKLEKKFDVTLIDTKNYFEFTPSILHTIVEPNHIKKIQVLHEHYLSRTKVIVGKVTEVAKTHVKIKNKSIPFDYLIISSGSSYNAPFKEQNVVLATRAENLRKRYKDLCKAKKILIIGGGLVGVELAGEILWKYKSDKEITIVHSGEKLIERNSEKAIKYAEKYLRKKGVKIIYNERVVEINKKVCTTDKKTQCDYDLIFLCTGIVPNFEFMKKNFSSKLNSKNQIKVNEFLQLEDSQNIFVAGDVNSIVQEKTAQNAEKQAETVVKNIWAIEKNLSLQKFVPKFSPLVISLGKNKGIFTKRKFTFSGIIPGWMKSVIERWEMWKKRI